MYRQCLLARNRNQLMICNVRLSVCDLLSCLSQLCAEEWQQLRSQCTSNKLHSVQPVIGRNRNTSLIRYDSVLNPYQPSSSWSYENHQFVSSKRRESTGMSNLPFSSHCQAHFDLFRCSSQRYTLKKLSENVESRNIVAFIKDTKFYHCM